MTPDDALKQLSHLARERAFGRHVGSGRLIQAGLDALLADVVERGGMADRDEQYEWHLLAAWPILNASQRPLPESAHTCMLMACWPR
ncbi:hypothetical protein [Streptomyces sp. MAI_2237]